MKCIVRIFLVFALSGPLMTQASETDPLYTERGFFDIHVCNWPNRPLFFLNVFSTTFYDDLVKVEIFSPSGKLVTRFNLDKYRVIKPKGKPEKHAFLTQSEIPAGAKDGWYSAKAHFKDGKVITARDYVIISKMPQANNPSPAHETTISPSTKSFTWEKVPGAQYYQVFIKDIWKDGTVAYQSRLLSSPELVFDDFKLEPGGYYSWRIHARDSNEHVLLGDFNNGSLTPEMVFNVSEQ